MHFISGGRLLTWQALGLGGMATSMNGHLHWRLAANSPCPLSRENLDTPPNRRTPWRLQAMA